MSTPAICPPSPIDLFLQNAERRRWLALSIRQLPTILGSLMAALALSLLFGTRWLPGICWAFSGVALLAFVLLRLRRDRLSPYQLAQTLDERLNASDALATAWFVLHGSGAISAAAGSIQLAGAERVAQSADLRVLFPLGSSRRHWLGPGLLCAVVLALLGLHYSPGHSLNPGRALLRSPLPSLPVHDKGQQSIKPDHPMTDGQPEVRWQDSPGANTPATTAEQNEQNTHAATMPSAAADENRNGSESNAAGATTAKPNSSESNRVQGRSGNGQENQEPSALLRGSHPGEPKSDSQNHTAEERSGAPGREDNGNNALTRMKDALSSLLSKLGVGNDKKSMARQNGPDNPNAQNGNGGQTSTEQQNKTGKEGGDAQSSGEQDKPQTADGGNGEQMDASSKGHAAPNGNSNATDINRTADQQGGAGRQNGSKSLHEAEQLKALGKLQEVLGKRAEQVTGEMSVESSSGTQGLQTQFSGKTAHHKDLGGEIHNEAVPPEFQDYVKDYMTHVHDEANRAH